MAYVTAPWSGPKTKDDKASPGRNCRCEHILHPETHRAGCPTLPKTCAAPPSQDRCAGRPRLVERNLSAGREGRHVKHAETPARPHRRRRHQGARFFNARPYHTRPSRGGRAHAPAHVGTTTTATATTSCASLTTQPAPAPRGRFGVEVGGKHHGTYVRTHGTGRRGETRLDFPHRFASIPPNAGGRPLGGNCGVESDLALAASRHALINTGGRAGGTGRRRCRRPFHPLVGAVRRRSRSRNGPRFVVPTCGGRTAQGVAAPEPAEQVVEARGRNRIKLSPAQPGWTSLSTRGR